MLRSTTTKILLQDNCRASYEAHQIRRRSSKAPIKRTVAVNVITSFIDHLLNARLRLSPEAESTKFRSGQRGTLVIGQIGSFIELLAHEKETSQITSLIRGLIGFDSD